MVSRAAFGALLILALLLAIAGLAAILAPSGSALLGIVLLLVACALGGYARNIRAAYLHREEMVRSWQWAQGLGPNRPERKRPW